MTITSRIRAAVLAGLRGAGHVLDGTLGRLLDTDPDRVR